MNSYHTLEELSLAEANLAVSSIELNIPCEQVGLGSTQGKAVVTLQDGKVCSL